MVRDPFEFEETPDLQTVLDALDDPDCREIVHHLDEPMAASDISEVTGISLSTTYRKLDQLTEASLLTEETLLREDGHHTTLYRINFRLVRILLDEDREFAVSIARVTRTADEQLAELWSEVRKET